ncbi:MerR family transcriptional regulator [Streptomyces sp. NPDC058221]|uniref:MerR family transcriptional regulator n=1 Tax=Streptomyces sp. NPDC058221 TaxID=3346388 RepID=UPI0036E93F29
MNDDTHLSIGELARRTGLSVKAIRSYSDRGIVPPAGRSPAGYRRYAPEDVAALRLVRTLRELGIGLSAIREVVERETPLPEVAAVHAEALAVQIRVLHLRRAVLTAVARRGSTPEEMELMHRLAGLSEDERRRLTDDFLDAVRGGLDPASGIAGVLRSMTPELPADPSPEQTGAWVELAELSQDPEFRALMRRSVGQHVTDRAEAASPVPGRHPEAVIRDHAGPALAAGIDPASPQAASVVAAVTADCARLFRAPDDGELRRLLLARADTANEPRRERYLQLLAVINGWPAPTPLAPALDWFGRAVRALARGAR